MHSAGSDSLCTAETQDADPSLYCLPLFSTDRAPSASGGAIVLGEDQRLGSIAAGKLADLVVIKGDPIARPAEIRNVTIVFKDGVGYDSAKLIEACRGLVGIR